jgi:outer membrane protein W
MGTKTFRQIASVSLPAFLALLASHATCAGEVSGKTADGCTYKIINGQYLTSCPSKTARPSSDKGNAYTASPAPAPRSGGAATNQQPGPVTDYASVPVYTKPGSTAPSLPPQQPNQGGTHFGGPTSSIEKENSVADVDGIDMGRRERLKSKLLDETYVGLEIGASNMKESNAGSSTGFGLTVGTQIDDIFGVELGYSYAKQDLNMGLASRGSAAPAQTTGGAGFGTVAPSTDSALSSNLFTGELQAHLTDPVKRLRPYVGAGLGWRSATLAENIDQNNGLSGGELHQNALGGLASAGTTLRITKQINLGFAFRYFFPLIRPDARLEQPLQLSSNQTSTQSQLTGDDSLLTGSSQYQVLGGVQYSF